MCKYIYKTLIITVFTLFFTGGFSYNSFAQDGTFFIQRYDQETTKSPMYNYQVTQMPNGEIMAVNHLGLLNFSGKNWNLFKWLDNNQRMVEPTKILPEKDQTFVGANNQIGVLTKKQGKYHYRSMFEGKYAKEITPTAITQIIRFKDKVFFVSIKKLFVTDGKKILKKYSVKQGQAFIYLFKVGDELFLSKFREGLFKWNGNKFILEDDQEAFKSGVVLMVPHKPMGGILTITYKRGLFIKKKRSLLPIPLTKTIQGKLKVGIKKAIFYSKATLLLSMMDRNGFLLNIKTQQIRKLCQTKESIYYIYIDSLKNIWLATSQSIWHIEASSPFVKYLKESIEDIHSHQAGVFITVSKASNFLYWLPNDSKNLTKIDIGDKAKAIQTFSDEELLVSGRKGVYLVNFREGNIRKVANEIMVSYIKLDKKRQLAYFSSHNGLSVYKYTQSGEFTKVMDFGDKESLIISLEIINGELWIGSKKPGLYRYKIDYENYKIISEKRYSSDNGHFNGDDNETLPSYVNGKLWANNPQGIYLYNPTTDRFSKLKIDSLRKDKSTYTTRIAVHSQTKDIYISSQSNLAGGFGIAKHTPNGYLWYDTPFRRLSTHEVTKLIVHQNKLYMATSKGLLSYDPNKNKDYAVNYPALIQRVTTSLDTLFENKSTLPYQQNQLTFEYSAPFYEAPEQTKFSYFLEGFDKEWSSWNALTQKEYTNLPEGTYTFQVKAKNVYGRESKVATYSFTILPPWYRAWWAYVLYILGAIGLLVSGSIGYSRFRNRQIRRRNQALEQVVEERTEEIRSQKEEITQQAEELKVTNEKLKTTNETLERTNETLGTTNEALAQANERIQKEKKLYLQETAEATSKLQEIRQMLANQGAATVDKMLGKEIKGASEFIIIRDKVRQAFPDFAERIDQARTDEDKNITPLMWQIAHCFKLGLTPAEVADILPTTSRSASSQGSALRRMGLLPPAKKFTKNKS